VVQRGTIRKKLMSQIHEDRFGKKPVLLDEFRWAVFRAEVEAKGRSSEVMPDAYKKSFNRTLAKHQFALVLVRVGLIKNLPVEVLCRLAVFRIERQSDVDAILTRSVKAYYRWTSATDEDRSIPMISWNFVCRDDAATKVLPNIHIPRNRFAYCVLPREMRKTDLRLTLKYFLAPCICCKARAVEEIMEAERLEKWVG
jgi:hypothetical protein